MSHDNADGKAIPVLNAQAVSILNNRYHNRGTAFTMEERKKLRILGKMPSRVETLEEQVERVWEQLCSYEKPINRYKHLATVHSVNTTLYYAVVLAHIEALLPIIYTPTVGEACQRYSDLFLRERGLYLDRTLKGMFAEVMKQTMISDVRIAVITDGSRILGLGDLGVNGVGISIGKGSLYVAGAGIRPTQVLPVVLDVGTNTERYLNDKDYLGLRERRCADKEFYELLDEFMEAASQTWPGAVIQFEDFSNNHCFDMLDRYQFKYRCFNDDIQGTGAVISAGFLNAVKLSGIAPLEHRIVVFGAGSAAVGVAKNIAQLTARMHNVDVDSVLKTFYLIDTKGLVTTTRGDKLASHKELLARTDVSAEDSKRLLTLEDIVKFVRPTALIGLGGVGPVFTEEIVKMVAANTARPIIFPLSNPTSKAEVVPEKAYQWTNGTAIVASGSPFPSTTINGTTLHPSQGNNLYVFPGIGLGCSIAHPDHIPDDVIVAAAARLSELTTKEALAAGNLYPPVSNVTDVSREIAVACIQALQELKLARSGLPTSRAELAAYVQQRMWKPTYLDENVYLSQKLIE